MEPTYGSTAPGPSISMYQSQISGNGAASPPLGEYTATTTVQSTRIVGVSPYFDRMYLCTPTGILKIIELICTAIAFIISAATWSSHRFWNIAYGRWDIFMYAYGSAVWTDIVTAIAFLVTLALLLLYLFHVVEKYYKAPWHLIELLYCLSIGFCLMIAGAVMIPAYGDPSRGAVVFFCWAAMLAYFVEAYFVFRAWRADIPSQGL